jgi:hypothetical protein
MKDLKTKKNGGGKSSELRKVQRQIRLLKGESVSKSSSEEEIDKVKKEIEELKKSMKKPKSQKKSTSKKTSKPRSRSKSHPKGKSHPSNSVSIHDVDIPSRASYKSKSTSHSPDEAHEITALKKKYTDKFFKKYDEVPVLDTFISLNQDIESVKLSDLKKMVGRELFVEEDVGIDVLIKELTDSGQWDIPSGMIINALFSILYLSVKFRKSLCVPEVKLAHNVLNNPMLHAGKYYLLEYRKTIDSAPPGIPSPETKEGFQKLLNYIMDYVAEDQRLVPQYFPEGFFSTEGTFGGTYRQKILRYLADENSSTILYDSSWWAHMGQQLQIPPRQLVRLCELLDGLTKKKLVYNRDYLDKYFKKCLKKDKRFIIVHLGLPQHANCLIYDTQLQELERFEPHGAVDYGIHIKDLDDQIKDVFISGSSPIIGRNVKYFAPPDYCPIGPQALPAKHSEGDPGGFCHWWTVYYMDLRLSNPDMNRATLLRKAKTSMEMRQTKKWVEKEIIKSQGKVDLNIVFDFNTFTRTYGAYLTIAETYLQKVIQDNTQDPYGILMTKAMEHFIRQVL